LTFLESREPGTLYRRNMDENIRRAVVRCYEAEAFGAVEPLYRSRSHECAPFVVRENIPFGDCKMNLARRNRGNLPSMER